jgi:hypothetical protein
MDVAQFDIPTLIDVRTYGDRLLIVFDEGEMHGFIVVIYNSEVYTRTYYPYLRTSSNVGMSMSICATSLLITCEHSTVD